MDLHVFGVVLLLSSISFVQTDVLYLSLVSKVRNTKRFVQSNYENENQRTQLADHLGQLETQLTGYHGNIVAEKEETKSKIQDMVEALDAALPKFQSSDPLMKLSGSGDLMMGIGLLAGPPFGFMMATFGKILSYVFSMLSSEDVNKGIGKLIRTAISEQFDRDLLSAMNGVKKRMQESKIKIDYYSQNGNAKKISKTNLQILVPFVEDTRTVLMGKIEHRIVAGARTYHDARLLITIINVYAYLLEIRSFVLLELQQFVNETGIMPLKAGEIELIRLKNLNDYRDTLRFLRQPDCITTNVSLCKSTKNYPLMHAYYPVEKNNNFQAIKDAMIMIGLPPYKIHYPKVGVSYRLIPNQYPEWSFCWNEWGERQYTISACQNSTRSIWRFKKDKKGYYNIYSHSEGKPEPDRFASRFLYVVSSTYPELKYQGKSLKSIGENARFSLIPANRDGTRFMIGVKAFPGYSLQMRWSRMNFALKPYYIKESIWKLEEL